MASKHITINYAQAASSYVNRKGINELFEAIMTALVIQKPDDHLAFIRECLDKAQKNPNRIRWELFVPNPPTGKQVYPIRSSVANRSRTKHLPPVQQSNATVKRHSSTPIKPLVLPPIEDRKKILIDVPVIFILNSNGSAKLCSRLMERYQQMFYISINDVANIDDDQLRDLTVADHRYDAVVRATEQSQTEARAYLITGHLDEKNFIQHWEEKFGNIQSVIILTEESHEAMDSKTNIIQIAMDDDFDDILIETIRIIDAVLPKDIIIESFPANVANEKLFKLPVVFCIDNHRHIARNKSESESNEKTGEIYDEFDLDNADPEEEINNSFINTLCERIATQFSFAHIHYVESKNSRADYRHLKNCIMESMSTALGLIIDHFPCSFSDLNKFRSQIAPCSALIYIGEHRTEPENDELNQIVEQFRKENKAIFVDCRMEVDEIYEDLRNELLSLIQ